MKVFTWCFLLCLFAQPLLAQESRRVGHTHDILEVKFNADGTKLISYSWGDSWLILWEVKSGRILWQSKTEFIQKGDEYYTLNCFAFSPDETLIVSGSGNGTVQLWDALTGRPLWRSQAHTGNVTAIGFNPDGKTIVSAAAPEESDNEIKILKVEDGSVIKKLPGKPCTVIAMHFSETGQLLKTGTLGGNVSQWSLVSGKQIGTADRTCPPQRPYEWETSFTPDLKTAATRTGEKVVSVKTTETNIIKKKIEADGYRIYSRFSGDGQKLVLSGYAGFSFYNLNTGEMRQLSRSTGTGRAIDLSQDGGLFAEGKGWGNAVIEIIDTQTGKLHILNGKGQRLPPYQPSELENRLNIEKAQRRALLKEELARRNQQAAIDAAKFHAQVYISFEHYGEMTDPGNLRLAEPDVPNKSKVKKAASEANAVWLRLHNDSPLPIKIPTQSMYFPQNPNCFYGYANGKKLLGLCDNREISIWHGLEDKKGKAIPYGFDFGSTSILLPQTSVLFPVPLELLKNGQAIHFRYSFLKETNENKIEEYGEELVLKFRQTDLRPEK